MLAKTTVLSFIPVSNLEAAEAFYGATLGLKVVERSPFAVVVATENGQMIRCALTQEFTPQPFTILGWAVPDIHKALAGLLTAGIEPLRYPHFDQDADCIWTAPGGSAKVVWFTDPDGNGLSISQHGS